jgi:CRISPR/Cas system CMR-associated protein Cmr5 small subunit
MDKETIALIIAQNGLSTAITILKSKAARLERSSEKASDPKNKAELLNSAKNALKLVAIIQAADDGIRSYMTNTPV